MLILYKKNYTMGSLLVKKNRFPLLPLVILVVGSILVVFVFFVAFSPGFFQTAPVETIQDAKILAEQYITRNYQGLEVDEIMEFSQNYYVIVKEVNTGIGAFELLVDRYSGSVGPEPGPNMMWNTKYVHHRTNNPTDIPITLQAAEDNAQEWLNNNILGATIEEATTFYGYYTMDLQKDGQIFGMLSVDGYYGEVWYHSWHGDFIKMEEY